MNRSETLYLRYSLPTTCNEFLHPHQMVGSHGPLTLLACISSTNNYHYFMSVTNAALCSSIHTWYIQKTNSFALFQCTDHPEITFSKDFTILASAALQNHCTDHQYNSTFIIHVHPELDPRFHYLEQAEINVLQFNQFCSGIKTI